MEGLLILLGLAYALGLPIVVIWLVVDRAKTQRRLAALETTATAGAFPTPERRGAALERPKLYPDPQPQPTPQSKEPSKEQSEDHPKTPEPETPRPATPIAAEQVPSRFVLRAERASALAAWTRDNWFLVAAAVCLVLAAVFLVQYGIEQGYLTPLARVTGAAVLGALLIAAGEVLRKRLSAADAQIRDAVASTLSGAGIVAIFAAILAARQLYGMIGPEVAFGGLAMTAGLAVLLGWFHGPFLAAVGLIGGAAAPFLVAGPDESTAGLFAYFALIAGTGLAIDAAKREAWLSVLALAVAHGAASLVYLNTGGPGILAFSLATVAMSAALPMWQLIPRHTGPMVTAKFAFNAMGKPDATGWPEFPTRLVAGSTLAAALITWLVINADTGSFAAACATLGILFAFFALWLRDAPALDDVAWVPLAALLAVLSVAALEQTPAFLAFTTWAAPELHPETPPPRGPSWLVGGAVLASLAAAWRAGRRADPRGHWWAALAAVTAPSVVIVLELFWHPARIIGTYPWALHAMGVAAVLTLLAGWQNRMEAHRSLRVSAALTMAMTMISLALILWFSLTALTLALAMMVLVAALLDRQYDLPPMGVFISVGTGVLLWRLLLDPGVDWSMDGPILGVLIAHLGVLTAFAVAWRTATTKGRHRLVTVTEIGGITALGTLIGVLIGRGARALDIPGDFWIASVIGTIMLLAALLMLRRAGPGTSLRWLMLTAVTLSGLGGALCIIAAVFLGPLTPLFGSQLVAGPWILNTLLLAYGLPGAVFLLAPRIAALRSRIARLGLQGIGVGLLGFCAALQIRHIWQGPDLSIAGVSDGELYSYTLALMLTSAGLMLGAWRKRSQHLRLLGVAVAALTIAKVFLVDMSGLAGLIRVVSFLGLGLALAGLALVNRWIMRTMEDPSPGGPIAKEDP